jgi:ABC-type transport system involved in multi-copper enzyme maturation permease subunit
MTIWTLAKKDLRLLLRDTRALVILLAMPFIFILVLGLSLGEGFGHKPDDRMRVAIVLLDQRYDEQALPLEQRRVMKGLPQLAAVPLPELLAPLAAVSEVHHLQRESWSRVVLRDLETTEGIRVERIESEEEAEQLVEKRERPAVIVFGPEFSDRVDRCSFLADPAALNPFFRDGVNLEELDVRFLHRQPKSAAAGVIEQVAQGSLMRVLLPWMIGKAFLRLSEKEFINRLGNEVRLPVPGAIEFLVPKTIKVVDHKMSLNDGLRFAAGNDPQKMAEFQSKVGQGVQVALARQFDKYDLTAQDWAALTKQDPKLGGSAAALYQEDGSGRLHIGARRYQILVPSYTVMFAFFLVLTVGWLFVAERRQGTLRRLQAAPLSRYELLIGKLLPCYGLSLVQGLILLLAGHLVFGMSWGPDPLWLLPVAATTSLAAMGLALLVAALARTETQVALYGTLLVVVLAAVSGCLMPREMMPEEMLLFSRATPHAWALDAYSELLVQKVPSLMLVATACGVLTAFGVGFLLVAWGTLRME